MLSQQLKLIVEKQFLRWLFNGYIEKFNAEPINRSSIDIRRDWVISYGYRDLVKNFKFNSWIDNRYIKSYLQVFK